MNNLALPKLDTLGVGITNAPYAMQLQRIMALGNAGESAYVCCVNAHMTVEAQEPGFNRVVNGADLATPDGMPVVYAIGRLHHVKQERVAGNDLMPSLLEQAAIGGLSVYLYGGSPATQQLIQQRASKEHPALLFAGAHSPPFVPLEDWDLQAEARRISESGAQLVLVSLGCPKQERFMAAMKGQVPATMIGLGGAFLLYAGLDSRAPRWMRTLALEWLYRLALEPRRLWKRYLVTNTHFIVLFLQAWFRRKTHGKA
ncbi:MAG: WecB/TagA/CpsF family glycosyltransferase [Flavobacteriales bacterium]|nr:WecB/TagA/CpsF family glycosyltransferase [Flavobacteriales bacterium]